MFSNNEHGEKRDIISLSENSLFSLSIILFFAIPLFYYNLGGLALVGPDEPRYAQVAREMYERRDWVTPTLLGDNWFEKPALLYWLIIPFYHLLGVNEWAARLPNALLATINLLILYWVAKRASGSRYGLWSAIVLASCGLYFGFARAASFDMPLTFTFTTALVFFHLADTTIDRAVRRKYLFVFYAAVGASLLAKGLVGIVLIGAIVGLYLILTRQWRSVFQFNPFYGLLICLAVAGLWYGPVIARHGWPFIDEFFIQHHFERYTSNRYHHPGPIYFFVGIIIAGVAPWSLFLIRSAARAGRRIILSPRRELPAYTFSDIDTKKRLLLLAVVWVGVPLLFFSLSNSKLPGYILPVFPALALIIAAEIEAMLAKTGRNAERIDGWMLVATAVLLLIIGLALPYFVSKKFQIGLGNQLLLAAAPIGAAVGLLVACRGKSARSASYSAIVLAAMSPLLAVAIASAIFPAIENEASLASLSRLAAAEMRPGEKIIFFNYMQYSPHFYTNGRIVMGSDGEAARADNVVELAHYLGEYESLLCIVRNRQINLITDDPRFNSSQLGSQRNLILLRLSLRSAVATEPESRATHPSGGRIQQLPGHRHPGHFYKGY